MDKVIFIDMLRRYNSGTATPEEARLIEAYYAAFAGRPDVLTDLSDEEQLQMGDRLYNDIAARLQHPAIVIHIPFWRRKWLRYAAAIIILLCICAYLWDTTRHTVTPSLATTQTPSSHDILPGTNRAILTLSNGKQVELNNAASETITDGTLFIKNTSGHLSYSDPANPLRGGVAPGAEPSNINPSHPGAGVGVAPNGTNTMTIPSGGQYALTLSDGTRVWLNAASRITYPTTFSSKTREVKITGEAYFEVAKNKEKPFIVKTPKEEITVLGTSFNINAYPDETITKTSLISGSIKVNETLLQPGQAFSNGKIIKTNIEQDLAWKEGKFYFGQEDVKSLFRQFARWYDVEVVYEGAVPSRKFFGIVSRNTSLRGIVQLLQESGIRCRIEGRTLYVQPD